MKGLRMFPVMSNPSHLKWADWLVWRRGGGGGGGCGGDGGRGCCLECSARSPLQTGSTRRFADLGAESGFRAPKERR